MNTASNIWRVAIIGAGNAGITAAKYLLAEHRFSEIDIFEQRSCVGGLWKYTPENDREASFTIPQTSAASPHEEPIWREAKSLKFEDGRSANGYATNGHRKEAREATFVSPMYERLESNLPKMIMQHSDMAFPEDEQLFASHEATQEYLERYAEDVKHLIRFETQTQRIQQHTSKTGSSWTLSLKDLRSSREEQLVYDAVIVASGHFTVPFVPDIPGVREWNRQNPGSVDHSKFFRRPEDYTGKKVITIGRGYSGLDIASQIAEYCAKPLLISTRQAGEISLDRTYKQYPEIVSLDPNSRTAHFNDGTSASDIDHILFCTGYLYSYPFFPHGSLEMEEQAPLWTADGARPHNLYQYIFYNADPTLAFVSIPQQIVPFPVCEAQAAVVARAWAGRLDLPAREKMLQWEEDTVRERGDGKKWLWLKPPADGVYLNMLAEWADEARPGEAVEGALNEMRNGGANGHGFDNKLTNGRVQGTVLGKQPARWGEKEIWIRERIAAIKKAFADLGEERHKIRTLEELGFDFDHWKREEAGR